MINLPKIHHPGLTHHIIKTNKIEAKIITPITTTIVPRKTQTIMMTPNRGRMQTMDPNRGCMKTMAPNRGRMKTVAPNRGHMKTIIIIKMSTIIINKTIIIKMSTTILKTAQITTIKDRPFNSEPI